MGLFATIRRLGRIAEAAPPLSAGPHSGFGSEPEPAEPRPAPAPPTFHGSLQLRHVDAGSCNGCEIEIGGCFSPVYDAERYGARLVASPRHADGLLVTGVVTRNMAQALRDTVDATPQPRVVIAVGDCARDCGEFAGAHGVVGAVGDVVEVDAEVPGCPPAPADIIRVLRQVTGR